VYKGDVQAMTQVSVSHLRQHLPAYLKRVQQGEPIHITSRGRVIARLEPEQDPAQAARQWLKELSGRVTLVDVVSPLESDPGDVAWSGDADHL
jgi:prevent-host-death family protein